MRRLLLNPTVLAQWQALLNEAQRTCSVQLREEIESYMVFLLMRFTKNPQLASSVLGLDFLESYHSSQPPEQLKIVGDKCLLFAGLFPGRAIKRRVKISYFVRLGQAAYSHVSSQIATQEHLFTNLCLQFPQLMDILQATRDSSQALDLLRSLELWEETGSQRAWQRLQAATKGFILPPSPKKSVH